MTRRLILIILFAFQAFFATAQKTELRWPELTRESRPWTRWWWPGSIVTKEDLTAAMEKYKKAGLGGMEIAVIYGVRGQEDKFISYLSPQWLEMFSHTLKEADRLGLGIDLSNASGWPFGGPWVDTDNACRDIKYRTYYLAGGQRLEEKIGFTQEPLIRAVGQKPEIAQLVEPISKNKDLQLYAIDQIRFEKPLPLYSLIAYSDSGEIVDLYDYVTPESTLDWTAPPGNWTIYALFEGWHGKMVERAGPGGEGNVIDHFSGIAIDNYLDHFTESFRDQDLRSLRGFFNDSYEVDDASGQSDWTDQLFYEFYLRRGYNLGENLPALFGKDDPEKNERVLSDYRQTMGELILEKFTMHWTQWANRQGKTTRNQAHGSPGNILDLYAASDIPETEGDDITRLKFASSAANVTGRRLASCEAATWLNEHFLSTLGDIKKASDKFFLSGINHLFYHGTCFSPQNEPWPGFLFYASVELTPSNPLWNDFRGLNSYITRVQSFLQQGVADNDILLYFPIFDRYAASGSGLLEHFDGISPAFDGSPFKAAAELMLEKGYPFDYISDLQIKNTEVLEGFLQTEGNIYETLILPGCKYIPVETFSHILKMANEGAIILVYDDLPQSVAGWADIEEKTTVFNQLRNGIRFAPTNNLQVMKATYGHGAILMAKDLNELLSFAGVRREQMTGKGIRFIRRATSDGYNYFVLNQAKEKFEGWLPLKAEASSAAIFNPMTGKSGIAGSRTGNDGRTEVYVVLNPDESLIITTYNKIIKGIPYVFYDAISKPLEIKGTWKVDFIEGGPVLPPSSEIAALNSWTDIGPEEFRNFSGTARYAIRFSRPAVKADSWLLDLGRVAESSTVILNGREFAVLTGPDFKIEIDKKLVQSQNTLEVKVSNLMANRIAYMDRNKIEWKKFYNVNMAARLKQNSVNGVFDASSWQPLESGLIGPVTISALKKKKIN